MSYKSNQVRVGKRSPERIKANVQEVQDYLDSISQTSDISRIPGLKGIIYIAISVLPYSYCRLRLLLLLADWIYLLQTLIHMACLMRIILRTSGNG
jgi:hypothetical protein